ncbi:STAS-like domain-containing protein [Sulfitobacter sp. 20_GPM-1509m]|uniref:STAS-like domain-containing protein n=1 Tax=Sulfitobacter sp. 20_GPM-1509m TaxID=1380367 RepID=UPI00048BA805|nr:STAS-like domain-containing protein [Sulfitobacter sp. 20_GPM-1509m]
MVVVHVKSIVDACDTPTQGKTVFSRILGSLKAGEEVEIDFLGVFGMTSSFMNCAFIPLLDTLPFEQIKRQMKVVHANRQIVNMLRERMKVHAERLKSAA